VKGFPTIEEAGQADKEQLARWYRFLPSGRTWEQNAAVTFRDAEDSGWQRSSAERIPI
jgi:hypothetical protein